MLSELEFLSGMAKDELRRHLQEQAVKSEEAWLERMISYNKSDDEFIKFAMQRGKQAYQDYKMFGEPSRLLAAEQWLDCVKLTKANKHTIGEIRKQRERIQWERRQLNQMSSSNDEPNQSLKT